MVRIALAGALSLYITWLFHEIVSFGIGHGFLTGTRQLGGGVVPSSISEMLFLRALLASISVLPLAGLGTLTRGKPGHRAVLALGWIALALIGLFMIADGYRIAFGTTWGWHEPFVQLMWSVWLTPLSLGIGLAIFLTATKAKGEPLASARKL